MFCESSAGGQGVAGSNPVAPTIDLQRKRGFLAPFFLCLKFAVDGKMDDLC